ncbi:hypothetical protein RclHR1_07860007 [Rhizophagus clarus]|uniref:BTB domain-containing protein n=1 Tax=Rhizophagus clarus TaxID=94130 RepID=A0A2Z6S529_9GLOM|nr:hypothetical protein RclHR1_07860007 [Rhizophagus clarus]GES97588.1 hypothetical protein GLOIN_2v1482360 [Rhizophagus clarus]
MKGNSLEEDLKLLINNPRYYDIEILCEDEMKLYGCRMILAARSEVLHSLLYNGMKESYEKQISFPKINSSVMKMILEYLHTGSIKDEMLTKDNIIEFFNAADYFQLSDLQEFIKKIFKNNLEKDYANNCLPELLSKVVKTMSLTEDNIFLSLLIEKISIIPLNIIEFGRLSIEGLQCLLSCTYEKKIPFATPEYDVFRYCAILAVKKISSDNAYNDIIKRLPTSEQLKQLEQFEQLEQLGSLNSVQLEKKFITDHQKVAKVLESLIEFIDFRQIKSEILVNIIEPLGIISDKTILNIYRFKSLLSKSNNSGIRGIPIYRFNNTNLVFDESGCGSNLIIEDGGKVVQAPISCVTHQSARANVILDNNGIFEWDVIIEKTCKYIYVGVCSTENFSYESFAGNQSTGWVVGSCGSCGNSGKWSNLNYCPSLKDGTKITVHLDLYKKTCSFTINGEKYSDVLGWNDFPSKLYPVVSLYHPGRLRIQPHQKKV